VLKVSVKAGGRAVVTNGSALCKIHHGAFGHNIIGISPDYRVHVRDEVLATVDGPTLQHAIKEMNGEVLRQVPANRSSRPDKDLLAKRFEQFEAASLAGHDGMHHRRPALGVSAVRAATAQSEAGSRRVVRCWSPSASLLRECRQRRASTVLAGYRARAGARQSRGV